MSISRLRHSGLFGGLADQAVVSLGNFGLNIALARSFSEFDYGAFALILSFVQFLNTLHQAYVTYPLSVQAAPSAPERMRYFLGIAVALTFLEMLVFLPVIGGAVMSVHRLALLAPTCAFLLAWQLQEVWRRGLLARARYGAAIANDLVRYIAPLGVVLILGRLRLLSPAGIFWLLAAASLLTCLPVLMPFARAFAATRAKLKDEAAAHWRMASPVLGANILAVLSSNWFLWLLAWSHNLASSAALVALSNIVAFSSPIMFGMENVLVPEIARRRGDLTFTSLMALLRNRSLVGGLLVTPLFAAVLIWPAPVLHLFYGAHKAYAQYEGALRMLVVAYATYLAAYILSAALRGYRATGAVFKMQLYPALLGITVGSWLTLRFGVSGACLAALLTGGLRAAIGGYFVSQLRDLTLPDPAQPDARAAQGI